MLITNKNNIKPMSIGINGTLLESCDQYKYLGVVVDKNLSWKPHVDYICKKISKACGSMANLRYSMNTKLLVEVYHSLIHSYLRYGIIVWGNASNLTLQPLKSLVNRAVRIITFAPLGRVDLEPIYSYLKVLDVEKVSLLETAKYMFKLKNDLVPVDIGNHFELCNIVPTHNYNLRNRRTTPQIVTRLESSEKSIQLRGEKIWQELPESLKSSASLNKFKRLMKSKLLESYVE